MELPVELAGVKVRFSSYYKYTFTFRNDDDYEISVGGFGDEIYRCNITANREYTIQETWDECGGILRVFKDGKRIFESE